MKNVLVAKTGTFLCSILLLPGVSCNEKKAAPSLQALEALNLKRGEVITCGPTKQQFGLVDFETSCAPAQKATFNLAIKLLHLFEYDEAEKVFAKIIDAT